MTNITADEIKSRMAAGEKINLVDVREPDEHAEFNIGGNLLPLGNIQMMLVDDLDDLKNKELVCYCRSGKRSMQACMVLETFGFTNVKNLEGGMLNWQEKFGG